EFMRSGCRKAVHDFRMTEYPRSVSHSAHTIGFSGHKGSAKAEPFLFVFRLYYPVSGSANAEPLFMKHPVIFFGQHTLSQKHHFFTEISQKIIFCFA
ncbi:MAG: hypothetical protein J6X38_01810, partial [Abditibacteriota bacterium]|nr:hypothetical protein [Abditibacteriota bacterium]